MAGGLELDDLSCPFTSKTFYDSVKLLSIMLLWATVPLLIKLFSPEASYNFCRKGNLRIQLEFLMISEHFQFTKEKDCI